MIPKCYLYACYLIQFIFRINRPWMSIMKLVNNFFSLMPTLKLKLNIFLLSYRPMCLSIIREEIRLLLTYTLHITREEMSKLCLDCITKQLTVNCTRRYFRCRSIVVSAFRLSVDCRVGMLDVVRSLAQTPKRVHQNTSDGFCCAKMLFWVHNPPSW